MRRPIAERRTGTWGCPLVAALLVANAWSSSALGQAPPPAQNAPYPPTQNAPYSPPPGYPPPGYPPPGYPPPGYPPPGYPPPGYRPPVYYAPPVDPPATATHLGLGYKIGNGLGFVGGDLIVSPVPHLALDLQVNSFRVSTSSGKATGYGIAPAAQWLIREPGRSTPYLSAGYLHASVTLENVNASLSGFFINAGYQWNWTSGLGILLGGGASHIGTVSATDGVTTITQKGGWFPNLEFSLRFMFI